MLHDFLKGREELWNQRMRTREMKVNSLVELALSFGIMPKIMLNCTKHFP